jgi:hypothetical protein
LRWLEPNERHGFGGTRRSLETIETSHKGESVLKSGAGANLSEGLASAKLNSIGRNASRLALMFLIS